MAQRLQVLHFATGKHYRGGERQVHWLHDGLTGRSIDSTVLCRRHSGLDRKAIAGAQSIGWHRAWDPASLFAVLNAVRRRRPALLHCHDAHALLHGAIAARLYRLPLIMTRRVAFRLRGGMLSRWKYGCCDAVVAISTAVRDQLHALVDRERVALVHSCVRWDDDFERDTARRALGLPTDAFVIGSVGYFTGEKRPQLLGDIAAQLAESHPRVRVACIGPQPREPVTADGLTFTGVLEEAHRYYRAFDAYLSVSRREGLGTALVDAVVRDIPSVATDAGGTRDIFPDGWDLVRRPDAAEIARRLAGLVANPAQAARDAQRAGERARRLFSHAHMVERTVALYDGVVGARPAGSVVKGAP
ncbi:MAG: glycosyltransferase [Chitinivibrionales bacterium]|nr:glycosyltransferase [Chitinivibrionales bacterium]